MTIANYGRLTPREAPEECHKCGSPVWSKGESGYYDLCDGCYNDG